MLNLVEKIREQIAQSGAEAVGLALADCGSSRGIWIDASLPFHPASMIKVCVLMEVFHQAEQGLFSLDEPLLVKNEFLSIVDNSPFSLSSTDDAEIELYSAIGRKLPIRELATRMITRSSNLATNILVERVTPEKVTGFMRELGADDLLVRRGVEDNKAFALGLNNSATAGGLMHILTRLARHQVVSGQASEAMIAILKQQEFNEGIPAGLPAGVEVAHKTGWNGLLYHDAGILYPPGQEPYVLAIMTRGLADQDAAPALVASLSRLVFDGQPEWRDA